MSVKLQWVWACKFRMPATRMGINRVFFFLNNLKEEYCLDASVFEPPEEDPYKLISVATTLQLYCSVMTESA